MRRFICLLSALALCLPLLTRCGLPAQDSPSTFDTLARWVPGDVEQVFFLDLKPGGEAGRHWGRIRQALETNPEAEQALDSLFQPFRVEAYGLDEWLVGPVANGYWEGINYVIAQVSDEEAIGDALLRHFAAVTWEQEEFEGNRFYHGRDPSSWQSSERLAWTVFDGFLFFSYGYNLDPLGQLKVLVSLTEEDSLARLPAWRTLCRRLPEGPMGLILLQVAEQARRNPPAPGDTSPGAILTQHLEAVALAAVPEQLGMRVEIAGILGQEADSAPELRALFDLPAIDPTSWPGLPADTAVALLAHDASLVWPWLKDILGLNVKSLGSLREAVGLDLEADLLSANGPLTGDLALAFTPPLPEQPVSQGLAAVQLLILARGATQAQADGLRAAMEGRGAIFGEGQVEGVALQTQVGTRPSGYAISYGFDGDTFLLGSSPTIVGKAIVTQRGGRGLIEAEAFQAVLDTLPAEPTFVLYLNHRTLMDLVQVNTPADQQLSPELLALEAFESIGLGLRLQPDRLEGTAYFLLAD